MAVKYLCIQTGGKSNKPRLPRKLPKAIQMIVNFYEKNFYLLGGIK